MLFIVLQSIASPPLVLFSLKQRRVPRAYSYLVWDTVVIVLCFQSETGNIKGGEEEEGGRSEEEISPFLYEFVAHHIRRQGKMT